ncbi:hypothetical protein [Halopenitus persicus]|uniref:hypothetical protein n=1 Tax=Halopenitus persicus TaxID=1048396 RepID=UPI000BBB10DE|nr:hypothetical protein [Halopenitus persicus]
MVQSSVEYVEYMLESDESDSEVVGDWKGIEAILEETAENDKVRISERVRQVYEELEDRREVFDENLEEIDQRIQKHENRLDGTHPNEEDSIRRKLMQLRDMKLQERKQYWRDIQDLKEELRGLLVKLDELDQPGLEELI